MNAQEQERYVDAAAAAIGLDIAAFRPAVLGYFALASGFADVLDAVPLEAADEPCMAFVPAGPLAKERP
jgi:hypothetical protein